MNSNDKIPYTTDQYGVLIFPDHVDLKVFGFSHCLMVHIHSLKTFSIIPFSVLQTLIASDRSVYFTEFLDPTLQLKVNPRHATQGVYMNGVLIKAKYHQFCRNKLTFMTQTCHAGNCHAHGGFQPEASAFQWNKHLAEYSPVHLHDAQEKTRKKIPFIDITFIQKTVEKNQHNLKMRGQRGGQSRTIRKERCSGCVYDHKDICRSRWQRKDEDCHVSRKAMNRRLRQVANDPRPQINVWNNWATLLEMFRYVGVKGILNNQAIEVMPPLDRDHYLVRSPINGLYARVSAHDIYGAITSPPPVTADLEYQVKIFLLFKSTITGGVYYGRNFLCMEYGKAYVLASVNGHNIYQYDFKSYQDVLLRVGLSNKYNLFSKPVLFSVTSQDGQLITIQYSRAVNDGNGIGKSVDIQKVLCNHNRQSTNETV